MYADSIHSSYSSNQLFCNNNYCVLQKNSINFGFTPFSSDIQFRGPQVVAFSF